MRLALADASHTKERSMPVDHVEMHLMHVPAAGSAVAQTAGNLEDQCVRALSFESWAPDSNKGHLLCSVCKHDISGSR